MVPLFNNKKVVFIGNENLDLLKLPFKVEKDFRVGNNCAINDFDLSDKIIKWVKENNINSVIVVHCDTSVGILNNIDEIGNAIYKGPTAIEPKIKAKKKSIHPICLFFLYILFKYISQIFYFSNISNLRL